MRTIELVARRQGRRHHFSRQYRRARRRLHGKLRRLEVWSDPPWFVASRRTSDFVLLDAGAIGCRTIAPRPVCRDGRPLCPRNPGLEKPAWACSAMAPEGKGTTHPRSRAPVRVAGLNYIGYVEGFDLFNDAVDVVVADGFTGNVVLKTAESLAKPMMQMLKTELTANPLRKFGAVLSQGAFGALKRPLDPEVYGGARVLGLNGIVIKAHGSPASAPS